mgnify:CR=1 FL=1
MTLQGLRPEEFEEFFWKESSLMDDSFPAAEAPLFCDSAVVSEPKKAEFFTGNREAS